MTVSVSSKTYTFTNGTANDAAPVDSEFTALFNNDGNLKAKVDNLLAGAIEDATTLTLNSIYTGSSPGNMAFMVERGTASNTGLRWNETDDRWEVTHDGTNYFPINYVGTADPATPADGYFWYNTTDDVFRGRVNGVTKTFVVSTDIGSPRSYLAGLTLSNNVSDTANDIDIAAGVARDSANANDLLLSSALTKRSDAAWAVGTSNGGMDTGSKPTSGTLHIWLIKRSDTGVVDALFSTSATAPTMPSSYDIKRRIGSLRTDGSGNIIQFVQVGDDFVYKDPSTVGLDINVTNPGTSAVLRTLSVPAGIKVKAKFLASTNNDSGNNAVYFSDPDCSDVAPSNTTSPLAHVSAYSRTNDNPQGDIECWTNTSNQIRSRHTASGVSDDFRIQTLGWIDLRGRLD